MLQLLYDIKKNKDRKFFKLKLAHKHLDIKKITDFDIIIAPPTGPECISTSGFDYAFIEEYIDIDKHNNTKIHPITFISSSFGAYKSTAIINTIVSKKDKLSTFYEKAIDMKYTKSSTPESLESMMKSLRESIIPNTEIENVINHKNIQIIIWVARLKPIYNRIHIYIQYVIFTILGLVSIYVPSILHEYMFDRLCFYTGNIPNAIFPENYVTEFHKLTNKNYNQVLKASSCIPGITTSINYIDGVGNGIFMDGAISDTHIGFKVSKKNRAIILNKTKNLNMNFFHKILKYPTIPKDFFENLSIIHPTEYCKNNTPDKRLPTLTDWFDEDYVKNPEKRINNWNITKELSEKYLHSDIKRQLNQITSIFDD
jgi:hypothetical protein